MASESYYASISFLLVIIIGTHIFNAIYFRRKGETILGEKIRQGSLGYEKFRKFSSMPGLIVASIIGIAILVNYSYMIKRIVGLGDPSYAQFILLYVPGGIVLFCAIMLSLMRQKLKLSNRK